MIRNFTFALALIVLGGAMMLAPAEMLFSPASVKGAYAFAESGFAGGGPETVVGILNADGAGRIAGSVSIQRPGMAAIAAAVDGSYDMTASGTGSMTLSMSAPAADIDSEPFRHVEKFDFVIVNKTDLKAARSESGVFATAMMEARPQQEFTLASVKGRYGFDETGLVLPSTTIGELVADGFGGVTGTANLHLPGRVATVALFAGQYSVNPDGAGTMTLVMQIPGSSMNTDEPEPRTLVERFNFVLDRTGDLRAARCDAGVFNTARLDRQE